VFTKPADVKKFAIDFIAMEASSTHKSVHFYLGAYFLVPISFFSPIKNYCQGEDG